MFEKEKLIVEFLIDTIEKIFRYTGDLNNAEEFENDTESLMQR